MTIKAQILLTRNEDTSPLISLTPSDSIMDVTGQPVENIPTDPDLVIWELWTEDLTPYLLQDIFILSSVEIIDEVLDEEES